MATVEYDFRETRQRVLLSASARHEPPTAAAAEIAGQAIAIGYVPHPMTDAALLVLLTLAADLAFARAARKEGAQ